MEVLAKPKSRDTTVLEIGPQSHDRDGLLGPNSIIVVYVDPLGLSSAKETHIGLGFIGFRVASEKTRHRALSTLFSMGCRSGADAQSDQQTVGLEGQHTANPENPIHTPYTGIDLKVIGALIW